MTETVALTDALPDVVPNENARAFLAASLIEDQAIKALHIKYCKSYLDKKESEKTVPMWIYFGLFFSFGASFTAYWNFFML